MIERLRSEERVFSSLLTFAEVHSTLAKRFLHERPKGETLEQALRALETARNAFHLDWMSSVNVVEITTRTLSNFPSLVERFSTLRTPDAIQLASALWLRDKGRVAPNSADGDQHVEFIAADKILGRVARACGLAVIDPEAA
jgi:hypothetical protein